VNKETDRVQDEERYLKPDGYELVYLVDLVIDGGCRVDAWNGDGGGIWVGSPVLSARSWFTHRRGVTMCYA
jgi:hypothetical protein